MLLIYSIVLVICLVEVASTMQQRRLLTRKGDHCPVLLTEGNMS